MKALSIQQPWAWLIVNGYKNVENRPWSLPKMFVVPQRICVHAGLKPDWESLDRIEHIMTNGEGRADMIIVGGRGYIADNPFLDDLIGSIANHHLNSADKTGIIGEVTITGCVTESDSPWFEGPQGFVLADPVAYDEVVPMRGRLGFWEVRR